MALIVVTVFTLIAYLFYKYWYPFFRLPLASMGSIFQIGRQESIPVAHYQMFTGFAKRFEKDGIFAFWTGKSFEVYVHDDKLVQLILKDINTFVRGKEYENMRPWLGESIFSLNGHKWKLRRSIWTPAFHNSVLQGFLPIINQHATDLIDRLRGQERVDIYAVINNYALGIICDTTMGYKLTDIKRDQSYSKAIREASRLILERYFNPFNSFDFIYNRKPEAKILAKSLETIHEFCSKIIEERKQEQLLGQIVDHQKEGSRKQKMAFLDTLLFGQKENPDITDELIKDEVNTIVFGGHDTTSSALTMILYMIAKHEDIQKKLQEEVMDVVGEVKEREVTSEDLDRLTYMDCIICETLRLYPPAALLPRKTTKEVALNGVKLPQGTYVWANLQALHRNSKLFPEPEKFKPERFLDSTGHLRKVSSVIPFSLGPRVCVGQRFALMEIKMTLVRMIQSFTLKCSQEDPQLGTFLMVKPEKGIILDLCPL